MILIAPVPEVAKVSFLLRKTTLPIVVVKFKLALTGKATTVPPISSIVILSAVKDEPPACKPARVKDKGPAFAILELAPAVNCATCTSKVLPTPTPPVAEIVILSAITLRSPALASLIAPAEAMDTKLPLALTKPRSIVPAA